MDRPCEPDSVPGRSHRATSFLDVLRELDVHALDTLFDHFTEKGCVATARLSFRGLRHAVDGSVRAARITVKPALARSWSPGQQSALSRFPRCTSVSVHLERDSDWDEDEEPPKAMELAGFVSIPFSGLDRTTRCRITSLQFVNDDWMWSEHGSPPDMDVLVSALSGRLPSLRALDLQATDQGWPSGVRQALMYDLLAANLPQLECLRLPSYETVAGVEVLSGSLKSLEVGQEEMSAAYSELLTRQVVESIVRLTRLQRLHLRGPTYGIKDGDLQDGEATEGGAAALALLSLLGSLPPSVEELCLDSFLFRGKRLPYVTEIKLEGGRIRTVDTDCSTLNNVSDLAVLLLESNALPPHLGLLRCGHLDEVTSSGMGQQPLQSLLTRCSRVEVGTLQVGGNEPTETVLEAVRLLALPERLQRGTYTVTLRGGSAERAAAGATGMPVEPPVGQALRPEGGDKAPSLLLATASATEVLCVAVDCMWGASVASTSVGSTESWASSATTGLPVSTAAAEAAVSAPAATAAATEATAVAGAGSRGGAAGGRACASSGGGDRTRTVLLRGTFFRMLGADPELLTAWLHWLVQPRRTASGRGYANHLRRYQAVPAADAVVVDCMSVAEAAALAAASARIAAAAGDRLAVAVLSRAAVERRLWDGHLVLADRIEQVVQGLWDASASSGLSRVARLSRLTDLMQQLIVAMPPLVEPGP